MQIRQCLGSFTLVAAIVTFFSMSGSLFADSEVIYTLQLGGDNNAADFHSTGQYTTYVAGSDQDNMIFASGSVITWDATVSASGTQTGAPGAGFAVKGLANFVFDLELHEGSETGPIVNQEVFFSSMHNGGSDCVPAGGELPDGYCPPCLSGAAFALSFNLAGEGPGRVIDPPAPVDSTCSGYPDTPGGGPNMGTFLFPTVQPGKLLGMGAGFHKWVRTGNGDTLTLFGVGDSLGVLPLVEGQIDTTGLAEGIYVLKLIPKPGTNVLRGDLNLYSNQEAFAAPADVVTGDTITFEIGNPPTPELVSAHSRSIHFMGMANSYDLELNLDQAQTTSEPRLYGPFEVILTFSEALTATDGALGAGDEVVITGASGSVSWLNGNTQISVNLGGSVPDGSCVGISLSGLQNSYGQPLSGDTDVHVRVMYGDIDGNGVISIRDLSVVKANTADPVTNDNCNADINLDEVIDSNDMNEVISLMFNMQACP